MKRVFHARSGDWTHTRGAAGAVNELNHKRQEQLKAMENKPLIRYRFKSVSMKKLARTLHTDCRACLPIPTLYISLLTAFIGM